MSSFTQFDASLKTEYLPEMSQKSVKDYWKVVDGFAFYLSATPEEVVRVPDGFVTDGASIPRVLWSILPAWGEYGQAAVVHDYLLVTKEVHTPEGVRLVDRDEALAIFNDAMGVLKVPTWKRAVIYTGVFFWNKFGHLFKAGSTVPEV